MCRRSNEDTIRRIRVKAANKTCQNATSSDVWHGEEQGAVMFVALLQSN